MRINLGKYFGVSLCLYESYKIWGWGGFLFTLGLLMSNGWFNLWIKHND